MPIQPGDAVPAVRIMQVTAEGPKQVDTAEFFRDRKVVLFGVPGAFTPTCSARHLPGFVEQAEQLRAGGADAVACVAVNDAFVMDAWGKSQNVVDQVTLLADGAAEFVRALGLDQDLSARGLGVRAQRFALIAENGVVSHVAVEAAGAFEVSSAEAVLAALGRPA